MLRPAGLWSKTESITSTIADLVGVLEEGRNTNAKDWWRYKMLFDLQNNLVLAKHDLARLERALGEILGITLESLYEKDGKILKIRKIACSALNHPKGCVCPREANGN